MSSRATIIMSDRKTASIDAPSSVEATVLSMMITERTALKPLAPKPLARRTPGAPRKPRKTCIHDGCQFQPHFNEEGEPKPLFCVKHKSSGMVYVNHDASNIDDDKAASAATTTSAEAPIAPTSTVQSEEDEDEAAMNNAIEIVERAKLRQQNNLRLLPREIVVSKRTTDKLKQEGKEDEDEAAMREALENVERRERSDKQLAEQKLQTAAQASAAQASAAQASAAQASAAQASAAPMYVSDMSLFIARVSAYPKNGDEHVIPADIEERAKANVARVVGMMEIGDIVRIDLKISKNNKTGAKHIDAFVHLFWFDTPVAVHVQTEISLYGKTTWYLNDGGFWVIRKNNNPMRPEEVKLMKDLGDTIREMLTTHAVLKPRVHWPDMDNYIANIDTKVLEEIASAYGEQQINNSPYGPRHFFMWHKYMRCQELLNRLRFTLKVSYTREAQQHSRNNFGGGAAW